MICTRLPIQEVPSLGSNWLLTLGYSLRGMPRKHLVLDSFIPCSVPLHHLWWHIPHPVRLWLLCVGFPHVQMFSLTAPPTHILPYGYLPCSVLHNGFRTVVQKGKGEAKREEIKGEGEVQEDEEEHSSLLKEENRRKLGVSEAGKKKRLGSEEFVFQLSVPSF